MANSASIASVQYDPRLDTYGNGGTSATVSWEFDGQLYSALIEPSCDDNEDIFFHLTRKYDGGSFDDEVWAYLTQSQADELIRELQRAKDGVFRTEYPRPAVVREPVADTPAVGGLTPAVWDKSAGLTAGELVAWVVQHFDPEQEMAVSEDGHLFAAVD